MQKRKGLQRSLLRSMSEEAQRGLTPRQLACSRSTPLYELRPAAGAWVPQSVGSIWPELAGGRAAEKLVPTRLDQELHREIQLLEGMRSWAELLQPPSFFRKEPVRTHRAAAELRGGRVETERWRTRRTCLLAPS